MAEKACTISQYKFYNGIWSSWRDSLYGGYAGKTKYITVLKIIAPTISNSSSSFSITIPWVRQESAAKEGLLYVKLYSSDPTTKSISTICSEVIGSYSNSKEWKTNDCAVHTTTFTFNTTSISSDGTFYIAIGCSTNFLEIGYSSDYVNKYSAKVTYTDTYTISYNANGGSGAPSAQTKIHGTPLTLSSTKPTIGNVVTYPTGTITISYNSNGSSATAPSAGSGTYTNTRSQPRTFYVWTTNASGTGDSYLAGVKYYSNASITLYAQYQNYGNATETRKTNPSIKTASAISRSNASVTGYKVTFDSNGSTATAPSAITSTKTRSYTFGGWNTNTSGSGTNYSASTSYTFSASITLYAKWGYTDANNAIKLPTGITRSNDTITGYKVTFDSNGSSATAPNAITSNKIRKYTFGGWNTQSDGKGNNYSAGANYTPSAATTLYAKWTSGDTNNAITLPGAITRSSVIAATYNVTLDANNAYCSNSSLSTNKVTSYTFAGWNTNSSGSGTNYSARDSYTPSSNTTLYAKWNSSTSTAAVTLPTPTRTGYTFQGWYTELSAGSKVNTTYIPDRSITLYARWKANTYTVKYNGNGSTDGSTADSSHTYDTSKKLTANGFTKRGYTFSAWNTKSDGTGDTYANNVSVKNLTKTDNGTINLYAQWASIEYTINYNLEGGTTSKSTTQKVRYDQNNVVIIRPQNVSRNKYDFKGWTTNPNGTPDGYTWSQWGGDSGATWCFITGEYGIINNTLNLYAIWEPSPFIITYSIYNDSYVNNQKVNKNSKLLSITEVMSKSGIKLKDYDKYVTWVTSGGIEVDWGIIDSNASGTVSPRPYTVYAKIEPRFKIVYKDIGNWKRLTPKLYRDGKWITPKINITK